MKETGKTTAEFCIRIGVCLALAGVLSGCVTDGTELPDVSDDKNLKRSPCACLVIDDYDGKGFEWTS